MLGSWDICTFIVNSFHCEINTQQIQKIRIWQHFTRCSSYAEARQLGKGANEELQFRYGLLSAIKIKLNFIIASCRLFEVRDLKAAFLILVNVVRLTTEVWNHDTNRSEYLSKLFLNRRAFLISDKVTNTAVMSLKFFNLVTCKLEYIFSAFVDRCCTTHPCTTEMYALQKS